MSDACDLLCLDLPLAEELRAKRLPLAAATAAAAQAKALGDPTRLTIAAALRDASELCVCDLSWIVERAENLVSHHVRVLRAAGARVLPARRQDGHVRADRARPRAARRRPRAGARDVTELPMLADGARADGEQRAALPRRRHGLRGVRADGREGGRRAGRRRGGRRVVRHGDDARRRGRRRRARRRRPSAARATARGRSGSARAHRRRAVLAPDPARPVDVARRRCADRRGGRVARGRAARRRRAAVPALDGRRAAGRSRRRRSPRCAGARWT